MVILSHWELSVSCLSINIIVFQQSIQNHFFQAIGNFSSIIYVRLYYIERIKKCILITICIDILNYCLQIVIAFHILQSFSLIQLKMEYCKSYAISICIFIFDSCLFRKLKYFMNHNYYFFYHRMLMKLTELFSILHWFYVESRWVASIMRNLSFI